MNSTRITASLHFTDDPSILQIIARKDGVLVDLKSFADDGDLVRWHNDRCESASGWVYQGFGIEDSFELAMLVANRIGVYDSDIVFDDASSAIVQSDY